MAQVLFSLYLAAATEFFRDRIYTGHGIDNDRMDGSIFNIWRLQVRTKVSHEESMKSWNFNMPIISSWSQDALNIIYDIYSSLGLAFNASKTELLYQ